MNPDDVSIGVSFLKPIAVLNSNLRFSRAVLVVYETYTLLHCSPNSTDTRQSNAALRFGLLFDIFENFDAIDEFPIFSKWNHKQWFYRSR